MTRVFTHPDVAEYGLEGHPESPARVSRSAELLAASGFRLETPTTEAADSDILLCHTPAHLSGLRREHGYFDPDTPAYPDIARIARLSLAGALSAADSALDERPAFSLMRPPGHHAAPRRVSGFCYLNNVAVATLRALAGRQARKAAILDIDVHHGDGTEEIVRGRKDVLFCSLHQHPLYPGTGRVSNGNCLNYPLPAGTDEARYLPVLEEALESIRAFKPDVLAVSAGFDTYKECPIAGLRLETSTYRRIGGLIAETNLPRFAVLEGGYADALPENIASFLAGFSD